MGRHILGGARISVPLLENYTHDSPAASFVPSHGGPARTGRSMALITDGGRENCCVATAVLIVETGMAGERRFFKSLDELPEDIFVENERGFTILGYPIFSAKLLIPRVDPTNFQLVNSEDGILKNISNASVHTIAGLYPLAKNEPKKRAQEGWYVLMEYEDKVDMDDQGWVYSWHFGTDRWKSKHGFVRRRVWVKVPEKDPKESSFASQKRPPTVATSATNTSFVTATDDQGWLIGGLKASSLDRQRFELLEEFCERGDLELSHLQNEQLCQRIRGTFQYESSADKFCQVWLPNKISKLSNSF